MKESRAKSLSPLLVAASMIAGAPAWAQDSAAPSGEVLKRIEALTRELEQLRAQVKANEEKTQKALEAQAVAKPEGKGATEGLSKQATDELHKSTDQDDEGVVLAKTAKASLKFYGMIDVGLEALDSQFSTTHDKTLRISNGLITPHFGVIGNGELAKGLQGSFNLEGSFAPDNGTSGIGGRLFGRQAWVGLSGGFGTLRLGRQYTMVRMGWEDANPYGTGNQGLRLLDARISNPRADNSISYLGKWGRVSAGVNLSAGWDAVNGNSSNSGPANSAGANCQGEVPTDDVMCHAASVGVKFDEKGKWGVALAHEVLWGGTATTFGGLNSRSKKDKRSVLGGYLQLAGGTKLSAGWIQRENDGSATTPKSNMYWLESVGIPLGNSYFVDALLGELKYQNSPNKAVLLNVRGRYVVSKETTVYMALSNMDNSGTLALSATASTPAAAPKPGGQQTSVITGVLYKF